MDGRVEVFMRGKGKYAYQDKGMVGFDENDPQVLLTFRKEYYQGFGLYFNFELMSENDRTTLSYYGITKEACMKLIEREKECFLGNASQEFRLIVEDLAKGIEDRSLDLPRARMQSTRLLYLLLHEDVEPLRKSEYTTSGQRKIAEDAKKRILQDPSIHLTAEELAEELHCTAPALKMYFRKVYGVPIYTFLQNVRLRKAEEDLRKTRKNIADLAEEAGYSNPSKFCALFKKTYGVTPTEYRRLHT
jgi:AraC-like DNA-binding protein